MARFKTSPTWGFEYPTKLEPSENQIAQAVRRETNPEAQLRAFKAWGAATGRSQDDRERSEFANSAVPKLLEIALANPDPGEQRAALQALASSRTLEAQKALESIAEKTSSQSLSKLAKRLSENIPPQKPFLQ